MNGRKSTIGLPTSTLMGKDQQKKVVQLMQALFDNSDSLEFRQPVPWKELNLLDYTTIVTNPIDLSLIKKKLNINGYITVQDCLDDIQLVWDNCKLYNFKGTWIHELADKLEKVFRKMIKNYLPFINTSLKKQRLKEREQKKKDEKKLAPTKTTPLPIQIQDPVVEQEAPAPSLEQITIYNPRRQFLYRSAHCTIDQLGILFLLIRNNSPECFKIIEGKVIVESQLIDDKLLSRLQGQLDMWNVGSETLVTKKK